MSRREPVAQDPRLGPIFDAAPVRVLDREEVGPGVVREIALRDILPVAGRIDEPIGLVVEHTQEANRDAREPAREAKWQ